MLFWLLSEGAEHSEKIQEHAEKAAEHIPWIVQKVNEAIGGPINQFELKYTKPLWDKMLGTDASKVLGEYTPQTAVPWYTVMLIIACIISIVVILLLRLKLWAYDPSRGQQTLSAAVLCVRNVMGDVSRLRGV